MSPRSSAAEDTAAFLQNAARSGSPVLIPGALERRPSGLIHGTEMPVAVYRHAAAGSDRGRLEHEREGGGAPSQRAGTRRGTISWRLWRSVRHPMQVPEIWRRFLPEAP